MKRRIIRLGGSTLVVSLPKKWVDANRLDAGNELDVDTTDQARLIITADGAKESPATTIRLTHLDETSIRTLITNTYRAGYDRITVQYATHAHLTLLKRVVKTRLIGFEIVRHDENACTVENVTEPSPEQFAPILRKLLFNIEELFATTEQRLAGGDGPFDYEEIEENIQKYDNFCRRVLTKERRDRSELLWSFLSLLLHGQRELYHLNRFLDRKPKARRPSPLLERTREAYALLSRAYLEKDVALLGELHRLHNKAYYGEGYDLLAMGRGETAIVTHHLLAALKQLYLANSPLAGLLV